MTDGRSGRDRPREPRLRRSVTLHLQGDWGDANLHRVCGWLARQVGDRSGPHTRSAIWTGLGWADNVRAVGCGLVDVALTTPAAFAAAAVHGLGLHAAEFYPHLRALGTVPQRDRLVVAVDRALGIATFAELRAAAPALRLATGPHDGVNHIGWAAQEILTRSGVPPGAIVEWGGELVDRAHPLDALGALRSDRANAIVHEAAMTLAWQEVAAARPLAFLAPEPRALDELRQAFGWPDATIPRGYFPGLDADLRTLDFSDFLVLARADMPDDLAYLIAWCMGETREALEAGYRHIPPDRSPVTYPLDPAAMGRTPVPLHPGAAAYYAALPAAPTDAAGPAAEEASWRQPSSTGSSSNADSPSGSPPSGPPPRATPWPR